MNNKVNLNQQTQTISQTWQYEQTEAAMATQGCAYLTPDSLMSYCQSRLQGLDSQVNAAFAKQQHANQVSSVLSTLLGDPALAIPSEKLTGDDASAKVQAAQDAIAKAMAALDKNSPEYQKLKDVGDKLAKSVEDNNGELDASQFQNVCVNAINDVQKDINSSSELSMISLQSLVSQRQQAISVCTNLVQSLGDQCNKIADNIGK